MGKTDCALGYKRCLPVGCVVANTVKDKKNYCKLGRRFDSADCGEGFGKCVFNACTEGPDSESELEEFCDINERFYEAGCGEGFGRCLPGENY